MDKIDIQRHGVIYSQKCINGIDIFYCISSVCFISGSCSHSSEALRMQQIYHVSGHLWYWKSTVLLCLVWFSIVIESRRNLIWSHVPYCQLYTRKISIYKEQHVWMEANFQESEHLINTAKPLCIHLLDEALWFSVIYIKINIYTHTHLLSVVCLQIFILHLPGIIFCRLCSLEDNATWPQWPLCFRRKRSWIEW